MLIRRFLEVAAKNASKTAVEYEDKKITYKELNDASSELADRILNAGIPQGSPIEICMKKSIEYVISIFGILKADCVYIPIDVNWPVQRVDRVGKISGAKAQITFKDDYVINPLLFENKENFNENKESAYVIFTSGSTGEPKGIPIKKRSVLNLVDGLKEIVTPKYQNISCIAPFCFDMSVAQVYYALLTGRKLVLVPDEIKIIPSKLCEHMNNHKVEVCDLTPTHLNMVLQYLNVSGDCKFVPREIISGGEALPIPIIKKLYDGIFENGERIINFYGPTETCVYATAYVIDKRKAEKISVMKIGTPMKNMSVVILSDTGEECEKGKTGEICIFGEGVSEGYIGDEEKKKKVFVKNPFSKGLMYKTGDYGYQDEENEIVCLGRKDDQIKIKGYRIELKEIENVMEQISSVNRAKAIVTGEFDRKKIVCFYTGSEELDTDYIKGELVKKIPSYMIPGKYIKLDSFEATLNGKIDLEKLHKLLEKEEVVKCKTLESEIINICAKILEVDSETISPDTDFVKEGAESIDIMELFLELNTRYGVNVDMVYLFEHSKIRDYVSEVKRLNGMFKSENKEATDTSVSWMILTCLKNERIETARKKLHYGVDFPAYNIVHAIEVNEHINPQRLRDSIKKVISLHGAFHTTFYKDEGTYHAKRDEREYIEDTYFEYIDDVVDLSDETIRRYANIFETDKLPLFKFVLFEHNSLQKMILNIHHGIFDYFSMQVFVNQLFRVYKGLPILSEETDFVSRLYEDMTSDITPKQEFWKEYLKGRDYVARFPSVNDSKCKRIGLDNHFSNYDYFLDKSCGRLKKIVKKLGVSEFIFLISLFAVLLSEYSGKNDVIMGTYLPGRDDDKGQTIGMFTKMVALRFKINPKTSFVEFVKEQQTDFSKVLKNQIIDLPKIYESLTTEDFMKGSLFDVIFNYVNDINMEIDNLLIKTHEVGDEPEKVPFSVKFFSNDERIKITVTVCDEFYEKKVIDEIFNRYFTFLDTAVNDMNEYGDINLTEQSDGRLLFQNSILSA